MIIPAVLMLVLCLGEFGKAAYYKLALHSAVRDGAHLAALHAPVDEVESVVQRAAGSVPIQSVAITQENDEEITVRVLALLQLKVLSKLGLPEALSHFHIEAESHVPVVGNKHG
jgi:hypothetical protein